MHFAISTVKCKTPAVSQRTLVHGLQTTVFDGYLKYLVLNAIVSAFWTRDPRIRDGLG